MADDLPPEEGRPVWPWLLGGCGSLAVAGLLLVAAAVVLPWLIGGGRRHEPAGSAPTWMMRTFAEAQVVYHRNDWDNNGTLEYATPYTRLRSEKDSAGQPLDLIDEAFAAARGPGGAPRYGYLFQDMETIAGAEIDRFNEFALCATPAVYGRTGRLTFIVREDGKVYRKDLGRTPFVTDYPKDPPADGWVVAE